MARITADDCSQYFDSRYEMVLVAARRARQLELGEADPQVEAENDKPTVVALREMAAGIDVTLPVQRVEEEEQIEVEAASEALDADQLLSDIEDLLSSDEVQAFSAMASGDEENTLDALTEGEGQSLEEVEGKQKALQADAQEALDAEAGASDEPVDSDADAADGSHPKDDAKDDSKDA